MGSLNGVPKFVEVLSTGSNFLSEVNSLIAAIKALKSIGSVNKLVCLGVEWVISSSVEIVLVSG